MSLRSVTWAEKMDEWHRNPEKLLAWITKLFWDAEIPRDAPCSWIAIKDRILIFGKDKEVKTIES